MIVQWLALKDHKLYSSNLYQYGMLYPDQQARSRDIIVDTLNGHSSYSLNGNLSLLKKTSKS